MEQPRVAEERLTPDAAEFVRFCYDRRPVGWPELYDEMCAVASRGLFRGWGPSELAEQGIGFALFDLRALAGLVSRIVAEEQAARRPAIAARTAARLGLGSPGRAGVVPLAEATTAAAREPDRISDDRIDSTVERAEPDRPAEGRSAPLGIALVVATS